MSVTSKANANQLYTMRLQLDKTGIQALPSLGINTMTTIECTEGEVRNLSVPAGAVLREKGQTSVLYDASTHAIHRCDVKVTRLLSSGRCLIASDGIRPGDLIVTSRVHHIKDGEQVQPLLSVSKTNVGGLL
jgi:efflux transporter, RND family, MFP subunit